MSPLGRVVEIAEEGRHLSKERGFLVISQPHIEVGRVPLDDVAALLATAPGTTTSIALLAALAERAAPVVLPGRNFAPVALVWPLACHHAAGARMAAQLDRTRPMEKRLWAQVISAKVRRQGWAIQESGQPAGAFIRLARMVKAGDPENLEAQAARRYWPLLLGADFRRDTDADGVNSLLNYGYAILRAATARAICAAGLHPGLGIHHRHPHNPTPLADDLMEPFRPVVDVEVRALVQGGARTVTSAAKRRLAAVLWHDEKTDAGRTPLSTTVLRAAQSLAESYVSGEPSLEFPVVRLKAGTDTSNAERLSDHVAGADVRPAGGDQTSAKGGDRV